MLLLPCDVVEATKKILKAEEERLKAEADAKKAEEERILSETCSEGNAFADDARS
jgi:hypothetical protein